MKLYVDDIRDAPDGYTLVRDVNEAINFIDRYRYELEEVSLDHDISLQVEVAGVYRPFPSPETYRAVAKYIKEVYKHTPEDRPKITLHSANPDGRTAMESILIGYEVEQRPSGAAFRVKKK